MPIKDEKKMEFVRTYNELPGNVVISLRKSSTYSSNYVWKITCTDKASSKDVKNCMDRVMQALDLVNDKIENPTYSKETEAEV